MGMRGYIWPMIIKLLIYALLALVTAVVIYLPVRRLVSYFLRNIKQGEAATSMDEALTEDSVGDLVEEARGNKERLLSRNNERNI